MKKLRIHKHTFTALSLFGAVTSSHLMADDSVHASSHAPISIMGDHMHNKGEWMVSYRFMSMSMSGNLSGVDDISDETIVTTVENRFGTPATLRVVPQNMTTDMHMLGAMYAPSDNFTLMAMLPYIDKDMRLTTYQGTTGTTVLGDFDSKSSGFGDLKVGSLIRVFDDSTHHVHFNAMVSLPTGSIDESGVVLAPTGATVESRLPYAMQLGSGTYDLMPGITYTGKSNSLTWGAQYSGTFRQGDNSEGYTLGDENKVNLWWQYEFVPSFSGSVGFEYFDSDSIDGIDDDIALPVQTADPDNYGRTVQSLKVGVNWIQQHGAFRNTRVALEYSKPIKQDVNGIQLEMDNMWTLGLQRAF